MFGPRSLSLLRSARARPSIVALVLIGLAIAYVLGIRTGMTDFAVNYRAGERLAAGETLYQTSDGHYMFKYFPSSALVYLPLTALPLEAAKAVWFVTSLVALAGLFVVSDRLVPEKSGPYVLLLAGLILAKYFVRDLRLGQINILVTLVMLAILRALSERPGPRAELRAGLFTGLAIALKPYAALILPYLILKRRWTSVAVAVAAVVAALAIPAVFYGIEGNLRILAQWAATFR